MKEHLQRKNGEGRQDIEEVVQRNLRLILGAQFTEKEGTRLIERAFNPNLSTAENKNRIDRLLTQIQIAAETKEDAAAYFNENGTLQGWKGKMPTLRDFEEAVGAKGGTANKNGKLTPTEQRELEQLRQRFGR